MHSFTEWLFINIQKSNVKVRLFPSKTSQLSTTLSSVIVGKYTESQSKQMSKPVNDVQSIELQWIQTSHYTKVYKWEFGIMGISISFTWLFKSPIADWQIYIVLVTLGKKVLGLLSLPKPQFSSKNVSS